MPQHLPPQNPEQPARRSLLVRANLVAVTLGSLAAIVTSIITVRLTDKHDSALIRLETVRVVVEAIKESRNEDPSVAASISEALRDAGRHRAANTLDSVIARRTRARATMVPVALPAHPDSTRILLARIDEQLSRQPATPKHLIAHAGGQSVERAEIQVIPVPAGATTATLPSGEIVGVAGLGALMRNADGSYSCGGPPCSGGQACCRIVIH